MEIYWKLEYVQILKHCLYNTLRDFYWWIVFHSIYSLNVFHKKGKAEIIFPPQKTMSKRKHFRLFTNANGTAAETKADSSCVRLRDIENDRDTEDHSSLSVDEHKYKCRKAFHIQELAWLRYDHHTKKMLCYFYYFKSAFFFCFCFVFCVFILVKVLVILFVFVSVIVILIQ